MAKLFTEAELEELRRADAEIEEGFTLTQEDLNFSRNLDREAKLDKLDNRGRKIAAQKAAYYGLFGYSCGLKMASSLTAARA